MKWAEESGASNAVSQALAKITTDAARVAGLSSGQLAVGSAADVCLFDPVKRWKVEAKALASQGKHTPFIGYELAGQVKTTIVGGQLAYQRPVLSAN
jgi:dihydroorotase